MAIPDKFSFVTLKVRVLNVTVLPMVSPCLFQMMAVTDDPWGSAEELTLHVNETIELIGTIFTGGNGPRTSDPAQQATK